MPSRKRLKPSPTAELSSSRTSLSLSDAHSCKDNNLDSGDDAAAKHKSDPGRTYPIRSWSRKAAPVTIVTRETVSVSDNGSGDSIVSTHRRFPRKMTSLYLLKSKRDSINTLAIPAGITTTSQSTPELAKRPETSQGISASISKSVETGRVNGKNKGHENRSEIGQNNVSEQQQPPPPPPAETVVESSSVRSSGWFGGWFARAEEPVQEEANKPKSQGSSIQTESSSESPVLVVPEDVHAETADQVDDSANTPSTAQSRSWWGIWGAAPNPQPEVHEEQSSSADQAMKSPSKPSPGKKNDSDVKLKDDPPEERKECHDGDKTSSWSFWYRGASTKDTNKTPEPEAVEVAAVANTPSHPASEQATLPDAKKLSTGHGSKQDDPVKEEVQQRVKAEPHVLEPAQKFPDNQVLPSVADSYPEPDAPSLLSQLGHYLYYGSSTGPKHLTLVRNPPKIKKALAIGIHGYFPAPFIRNILGQPTGTSVKFANSAADALRRWTDAHNYSCQVEVVALEGEGHINERVDMLWKLLLDSIDAVREADFILVACHSQGVPVAIRLVEKLIQFGCVSNTRIGVCAMAGINTGPQAYLKSRFIGGVAGELFEFSRSDSQVSQDYMNALRTSLDFGVKIAYIGSIDDQVVSLESSTFSIVSHPNLFRAVFVDGRIHAPNFLTKLVGFVLKLRNLGVSDHGLIRELSAPLAGSLYSGEGHSRIYEDRDVYYLAIEFALGTTSIPKTPLEVSSREAASQNPYILPFAMRGLLEEECVKTKLAVETENLLKEFSLWKPSSKQLKDVKFRLEGVRSRL